MGEGGDGVIRISFLSLCGWCEVISCVILLFMEWLIRI